MHLQCGTTLRCVGQLACIHQLICQSRQHLWERGGELVLLRVEA